MAITPLSATIDLNPSYKVNTVVYVSQLDNNLRQIAFTIQDGGVNYDVAASGYDVYIEGTKPDNRGFSYKVTDIGGTVSGSVVTVPIQTQMTAVQGLVSTEIVLKSGANRIGSANFILMVERAGLADDIDVSETDIPGYINGAQQAAAAAAQSAEDAEDAKDTAVNAATTAQNVLDSIPEDYSQMSEDLGDLKSALEQYEDIFTGDVDESVQNWLDVHPEATTTVEDHSLTYEKLVNGTLNFVTPEMLGAKGDGVTDDEAAFHAFTGGFLSLKPNKTYLINASRTYVISTNDPVIIEGNGATIHIVFSGNNAPRFIYHANTIIQNVNFIVDVSSGSSRARVIDNNKSFPTYLQNVTAKINTVPGTEKISFAECGDLTVVDCDINNDSQCTTDGGTIWCKDSDSILIIKNSRIIGNHHDETIANYGTGNLHTLIDSCDITTASKITLRSISNPPSGVVNKSFASIRNSKIHYTVKSYGLDIGGRSANDVLIEHCAFSGLVSILLSTSTVVAENNVKCSVVDCDLSNLTYDSFANPMIAFELYVENTDINYLMTNPTTFNMKRISVTNSTINETFLMFPNATPTVDDVIMDTFLTNVVINSVHFDDTKSATKVNPHAMISAFIAGTYKSINL